MNNKFKVIVSIISSIVLFSSISCTRNEITVTKVNLIDRSESQRLLSQIQTGKLVDPFKQVTTVESSKPLDNQKSNTECDEFRNSLPENVVQNFIQVPENWNQPEGKKINVFYYYENNNQEPVVFYNGGPAADSHSSFQILSQDQDYNKFKFVFIDQRGTGCSDSFPTEISKESLERIRHYSSRNIVRDSEAIREKLFGKDSTWKIFGQSFGGHIVQRYIATSSGGVKSAHSHGFSVMSDSAEWLTQRLMSQKRVLQDYFKQYPADKEIIQKVRSKIPDGKCFKAEEVSVCGPKVLDALTIFLGFSTSWPSLHKIVEGLNTVNADLFEQRLKRYVENYAIGIYGNNYALGSVLGFVDQSNEKQLSWNFCEEPLKRLKERGENPDSWIINECRLMPGLSHETWDPLIKEFMWTPGLVDELTINDIKSSLLSKKLPFYLYAGKLDVFVPVETFTEQVSALNGLMSYTLFDNSGHEGFHTERLVWQNLSR